MESFLNTVLVELISTVSNQYDLILSCTESVVELQR